MIGQYLVYIYFIDGAVVLFPLTQRIKELPTLLFYLVVVLVLVLITSTTNTTVLLVYFWTWLVVFVARWLVLRPPFVSSSAVAMAAIACLTNVSFSIRMLTISAWSATAPGLICVDQASSTT